MFIQVSPHRLTKTELEVWIDGSMTLVLGQVLRFDTDSPLYAQLLSLEDGRREGFWLARLKVILGTPTYPLTSAMVLTEEELAREIHLFRGGEELSFQLGEHFSSDLSELGTITLIESPSVALKQQVLGIALHEIQAYQRQVIVDPVGLFASQGGSQTLLKAGRNLRLSLQKLGILRFLTLVGECFPPALREEGLRMLSKVVPATPDFIPLRHFLRPERYPDLPVKTPLLHALYEIYQQQVFADSPEDVFDLSHLLSNQMTALDLSLVKEPWRTMMYEEICREILEDVSRNVDSHIVFTLVYPESYLGNLEQWVRKAYEAGLNLLIVPASYEAPRLHSMANNFLRVDTDGWAVLQGSNTLGFPLKFRVRELAQKRPASAFFQEEAGDFQYQAFSLPPAEAKASRTETSPVPVNEATPSAENSNPPAFTSPEWQADEGAASSIIRQSVVAGAEEDLLHPPDARSLGNQEHVSVWSHSPSDEFLPQSPADQDAGEEEPDWSLGEEPGSQAQSPWTVPEPEHRSLYSSPSLTFQEEDEDDIFRSPAESSELSTAGHDVSKSHKSPGNGLDFSSDMFDEEEEEESYGDVSPINSPSVGSDPARIAGGLVSGGTDILSDGDTSFQGHPEDAETQDFTFRMEDMEGLEPGFEPGGPTTSHEDFAGEEVYELSDEVNEVPEPPHSRSVNGKEVEARCGSSLPVEDLIEEPEEQEPMQETVPVYRVHELEQQQMAEQVGYQEGDRIRHEKYGTGIINKVHPDAMDGKILLTVVFEAVGKRIIDPSLAGIEKV